MFTVIETDKGKDEILTQQYEISTYVIVNNNPSMQFSVDMEEAKFHREIRKDAIKNGYNILDGTKLDLKSKYPINEFKE